MKVLALVLAILLIALPCAPLGAQTTTHYLSLGADPQNPGRQVQTGEVAILSDSPICDTGWGSGSGKKSNGCYPTNTLVFVDAVTHVLNAVGVCGNEPSQRHIVTGKIITVQVALPPAPLPNAPAAQTGTTQQVCPPNGCVQYSSSTTTYDMRTMAEEARQTEFRQPAYEVPANHHWGWIVGGIVVGGVVAAIFGLHHSSPSCIQGTAGCSAKTGGFQ